jgi:putative glutamine amidotransferase
MSQLIIGMTDCSKYGIYHNWVANAVPSASIIKLGAKAANLTDANQCHGIVLTGGEDVHPRFYNRHDYLPFCYADDLNEQRDEFELKLLERTESLKIPVLGICRGMQIANVFFGGTLIPDLPTWGKQGHSKHANGTDSYHEIKLTGEQDDHRELSYEVNSNHHQAVEITAEELVITAWSPDGVAEAAERKQKDRSFLQLVQWHPERMKDQASPLSSGMLSGFVLACRKFMQQAG